MRNIKFQEGICPFTGKKDILMKGKNPLVPAIGFNHIKNSLNALKIEDADFFCRTFDIPFDPNLWIKVADEAGQETFFEYAHMIYDEKDQYRIENKTTWIATTREWSRVRKQRDIINSIDPIKKAYEQRAGLVWGEQFSFKELIELDSLYTQSLQANNITNPLQKKSLKTLLKIMMDMDKAILNHDSSELKSLASAFKTLATTAQLDEMIENTKTDDITTIAELVTFVEESGFELKFYDGRDKDAIDMAITNIQESNARLVRDATGIGPLLEDLTQKYKEQKEKLAEKSAYETVSIEDIEERYTGNTIGLDIAAENEALDATESDSEILEETFEDE